MKYIVREFYGNEYGGREYRSSLYTSGEALMLFLKSGVAIKDLEIYRIAEQLNSKKIYRLVKKIKKSTSEADQAELDLENLI
jgi:hypothetical protein